METFKRFGLTFHREYNEKGQLVEQRMVAKNSEIHSYFEYDEKGHMVHFRDNTGYEYWVQFDNQGREVFCWTNNGRRYRREYNQRGDLHYKDTFNVEFWSNKERKVITPEQFSTP